MLHDYLDFYPILDLSHQGLEGSIFCTVQYGKKNGYSEKFLEWFKTKILLCKGGMRKTFSFMKFFDWLVKFWTLPYGPKAQCTMVGRGDKTCFELMPFSNAFGYIMNRKSRFF